MRCLYDGVHPCGKCPACLANRQRAFCFRLDQEKENCAFYFWLTLQYSDEFVPRLPDGEMCFSKSHCRGFFEKLRKRYKKDGYKFKHFLVSEYGPNGTHRPHYHCLLMVYADLPVGTLYLARKEMRDFICNESWPYGFVCEKSYHGRVLSYLTKYCSKPELIGEKHTMKTFTLISPGIGLSFLDKIGEHRKQYMLDNLDFTYTYNGKKIQLPRYYVDKMFPHSKKDLMSLVPDDMVNGDWSRFDSLKEKRDRLRVKQNYIVSRRVHALLDYDPFAEIKKREINIGSSLEEFRSKLKNRKEL